MTEPRMKTIANQPSFILQTTNVEAALSETAGMLAPVTFHRDADPVQPYSIAPWAEEELGPDQPPLIHCLRGDFICSAFGGNDEPYEDRQLPVHGETAHNKWSVRSFERADGGEALHLTMDLEAQGGRCDAHTALVEGHNVVYQRHEFADVKGAINPGHHACVKFPDREGSGRLSFSKFGYAHTFVEPTENPADGGYSILKPDQPVTDLKAVPLVDGSTTDVTVYPARRGYEDIMIICADPSLEVAWSAVTFPNEGYVWFTLRDPKVLPSTLLWITNGGRHYAPWNGRHVNVMGVEDMIGFFHTGLAPSARENLLNEKGVATCHRPAPGEMLIVPYIQGVARVPDGFDRVKDIEVLNDNSVRLVAESGKSQQVPCYADFVKTGKIMGLI